MKRYELKVKFGRSVIVHKVFEFTNKDQADYLRHILKNNTMHKLCSEVEDVMIKTLGTKYWVKNYPKDVNSLYNVPLVEFAQKYPNIVIAAYTQYLCNDAFHSFDFSSHTLDIYCTKEEVLIDRSQDCEWTCKILKD